MPESALGRLMVIVRPVGVLQVRPVAEDDRRIVEAAGFLDPPVELEDEVAVFVLGPEIAIPLCFGGGVVVNDAVHHLPVAVVSLRNDPTAQIGPVEQGGEAVFDFSLGRRGGT